MTTPRSICRRVVAQQIVGPLLPMASPGNGGLIYGDKTILTREVTLKSMNSTATLLLDQPNRFVFAWARGETILTLGLWYGLGAARSWHYKHPPTNKDIDKHRQAMAGRQKDRQTRTGTELHRDMDGRTDGWMDSVVPMWDKPSHLHAIQDV